MYGFISKDNSWLLFVSWSLRFFSKPFLDSFLVPDCQTPPKLGSQLESDVSGTISPRFSMSISALLLSAHAAPTRFGLSFLDFPFPGGPQLLSNKLFGSCSFAFNQGGGAPVCTFAFGPMLKFPPGWFCWTCEGKICASNKHTNYAYMRNKQKREREKTEH